MMLTIRRQLVGSGLLAVAGFLVFGVVAYATLRDLEINGTRYKRIVGGKDLVADVVPPQEYLVESYLAVLQMLEETDRRRLEDLIQLSRTLRTNFEERHTHWEKELPMGPLREALLTRAYEPGAEFLRIRDEQLIPAVRAGDHDTAQALAANVLKPLYEQHRKAVLEVVRLATEATVQEEKTALATARQATSLLPLIGLVIAAITVGAGFPLSTRIIRALEQTRQVAERTASGDLTSRVNYTAHDELGQLATSTNRMVDSLREILSHIGGRAVTLATASEELSSVSSQMIGSAEETSRQASLVSRGSEQISRNVESVSVSVEEMTASIQEISKNTNQAARIATVAAGEADVTTAAVSKLGASSLEIGKVVEVINTIAQQTNLLALNAAIEAARAGEAGKGFAVVANEVKELANETATATKDISLKIEAIQTDTTDAVQAISKISETIQQIRDISNSIAAAIEQQLATSGEIGRNLAEAARGTNEVSTGIGKVAAIAHDTAGGSENTQLAAEELARLAVELRSLTNRFRFTPEHVAQGSNATKADGGPAEGSVPILPIADAKAARRVDRRFDGGDRQAANAG